MAYRSHGALLYHISSDMYQKPTGLKISALIESIVLVEFGKAQSGSKVLLIAM